VRQREDKQRARIAAATGGARRGARGHVPCGRIPLCCQLARKRARARRVARRQRRAAAPQPHLLGSMRLLISQRLSAWANEVHET
jgi:hypothetical protein